MKTRVYFFPSIGLLALAGTLLADAAPTTTSEKKTKPAAQSVETNKIPQSVFAVPSSDSEGRDLFFPNRRKDRIQVVKPTPSAPAVTLTLNGISGSADRRLVIINGKTFAQGESSEVPVSTGRVMIRCVEIREASVIVEVSGKQQELHLRDGGK